MAISTQISRLTTLRNSIRTKLIDLGILPAASTSATLSECYNVLSTVTGLAATSYTPTTTTQTISSGYYLKGAQTINAIPSTYIIPTGTSTVTSNGIYDVKAYASASVSVPYTGRMITISGTGGDGCYVNYNNVVYTSGTINFHEGDTLSIYCAGGHGGGSIYVNGERVAYDPYDMVNYDLTLPNEDVEVVLAYNQGTSRIDVNYNYLLYKTITSNGEYEAWIDGAYGYNGVNVSVPIPSGYLIPTGTISLSSNGTYDVASYASASISVQGGPSDAYVYWSVVSGYSCAFGNLNSKSVTASGFMANTFIGGFDSFENLYNFNSSVFKEASFYMCSNKGGFSKYYNSENDLFKISFPNFSTKITISCTDVFRNATFNFTNPHVLFEFPNLISISVGMRTFAFSSVPNNGGWIKFSFPVLKYISGHMTFGCPSILGASSEFSSSNYPGYIQYDRRFSDISYCSSNGFLTDIYAPVLETLSCNNTFAFCQGLSSLNFPSLVTINGAANFLGCYNLTSISLPLLESLTGNNQFTGCYNLSYLYLPKLKSINDYITGNIYKEFASTSFSSQKYISGSYSQALGISIPCGVEIASFPDAICIKASAFCKAINLREIYLNKIELISNASYAFAYCPNLSSFYAPSLNCISYTGSLFTFCFGLSEINLENLSIFNTTPWLFASCFYLTTASFPKLESIVGVNAMFQSCSRLENVYMPSLVYASSLYQMFSGCSALSSIEFPKLLSVNGCGYMFYNCSNLLSVSFPSLAYLSSINHMFYNCSKLLNISFPELSIIDNITSSAFNGCQSLSFVFFNNLLFCSSMANTFSNCRNLISMFFTGSVIIPLPSTVANIFGNTPISSYSASAWRLGSIYVPSSLLATYKAATNWTAISSKIFAYESFFGTIGSFGYVNSAWTPKYYTQFIATSVSRNGYYWSVNNNFFTNELSNHCTVIFDGVTYPLATYSSNASVFGAPLSGTSHNWTWYPFHFDKTGCINVQSSGTHTIRIYTQLP